MLTDLLYVMGADGEIWLKLSAANAKASACRNATMFYAVDARAVRNDQWCATFKTLEVLTAQE
jgi:hypothetical protein